MAHAAAAILSQPQRRIRTRTSPSASGVRIPPGQPAHATKPEALKLLRKFSDRSPLPLGTLRAQLIPDSSWKRSETSLGPTAVQTVERLRRALAFATRTWKSEADAIDWLLGTHSELGGATPFSLLRTESGGRSVDYLMAALEFGFPV
jgi:hypothetical protein